MKLRTIHRYLKKIVKSPEDPNEAIDAFLDAYWLNHIDSDPMGKELWNEIRFLACELKLFDPNPESHTKGFFGVEHAVIITEKVIQHISLHLTPKPAHYNGEQNSHDVLYEEIS